MPASSGSVKEFQIPVDLVGGRFLNWYDPMVPCGCFYKWGGHKVPSRDNSMGPSNPYKGSMYLAASLNSRSLKGV